MRRLLLIPFLLLLAVPAAALARDNPADALLHLPIEASRYDKATHCSSKSRPGVVRLTAWLEENVRGEFWGSYRCEMWGKKEASLHAENRAIDWHLDVNIRADRRAAKRLIALLLATDAAGNPQALARRMGVEELIWDCEYWMAGMTDFIPYRVCLNRRGKEIKGIDPTVAHRDHVHIGMTRAGAAAKTSFWRGHTD
ncbi:MAG: hypothetical protein ABWZ67_09545 [Solirubrobacteraceae bacterium]